MESGGGCCGGSKKPAKPAAGQAGIRNTQIKVGQNPFAPDTRYKKEAAVQVMEAKVVLLGDSGVGKSSIAQRFCRGIFSDSHDVTIGGAYLQQTIAIQGQQQPGAMQPA